MAMIGKRLTVSIRHGCPKKWTLHINGFWDNECVYHYLILGRVCFCFRSRSFVKWLMVSKSDLKN